MMQVSIAAVSMVVQGVVFAAVAKEAVDQAKSCGRVSAKRAWNKTILDLVVQVVSRLYSALASAEVIVLMILGEGTYVIRVKDSDICLEAKLVAHLSTQTLHVLEAETLLPLFCLVSRNCSPWNVLVV
jgi:hypothetical protein